MVPLRNIRRFFYKSILQPKYALRTFALRFRANLYYYFSQGKSSLPEALTFFLTHRCNLRCKMCGQWGERGVTKEESKDILQQELSFPELKKLVKECSGFRPNITLFGGEPLLHPACLDLIEEIKKQNMHCLMITNGSLLQEFAEKIVRSGLDELNVSLDGAEELHNQIRGIKNIFEKIFAGLIKINEYKKIFGYSKPLINIQCTISKYNYQQLEELIPIAKKIKAASLTYHNLIFIEEINLAAQKLIDKKLGCASNDWEGFKFEPGIDPKILHKKIKDILSKKYPFIVDFYPNFSLTELIRYYSFHDAQEVNIPGRCLSPWLVGYVFPDGSLRPCLNSSFSFGNIKEKSIRELWNNAEAISFRRLLKKERSFPVCCRCTEFYRY